jgi:hypothetical protein
MCKLQQAVYHAIQLVWNVTELLAQIVPNVYLVYIYIMVIADMSALNLLILI